MFNASKIVNAPKNYTLNSVNFPKFDEFPKKVKKVIPVELEFVRRRMISAQNSTHLASLKHSEVNAIQPDD